MRQRYRRIRCIGQGSYGRAFLAEDAEGRHCALKQIPLHGAADSGEAALREVRLLRRMRHPYIIRYKDAFLDGGKYLCICMEYGTGALGQAAGTRCARRSASTAEPPRRR